MLKTFNFKNEDGKFATCIACNTYNKKVIQDGLKYLKNATVYIIDDGDDSKENMKSAMEKDKDCKYIGNSIFKTKLEHLKELNNAMVLDSDKTTFRTGFSMGAKIVN